MEEERKKKGTNNRNEKVFCMFRKFRMLCVRTCAVVGSFGKAKGHNHRSSRTCTVMGLLGKVKECNHRSSRICTAAGLLLTAFLLTGCTMPWQKTDDLVGLWVMKREVNTAGGEVNTVTVRLTLTESGGYMLCSQDYPIDAEADKVLLGYEVQKGKWRAKKGLLYLETEEEEACLTYKVDEVKLILGLPEESEAEEIFPGIPPYATFYRIVKDKSLQYLPAFVELEWDVPLDTGEPPEDDGEGEQGNPEGDSKGKNNKDGSGSQGDQDGNGKAQENRDGNSPEQRGGKEGEPDTEAAGEQEEDGPENKNRDYQVYSRDDWAISNYENPKNPKDATKNDVVFFGMYEQDGDESNGTEAIPWFVLENEGDALRLLSVYVLEKRPYYEEKTGLNSWDSSDLRTWLNGDFYHTAFDEKERESLILTHLTPDCSTGARWAGGDTDDNVWILSGADLETYFGLPVSMKTNPWYTKQFPNNPRLPADAKLGPVDQDEGAYPMYCNELDGRILASPTDTLKAQYADKPADLMFMQRRADQMLRMLDTIYDMTYAVGSTTYHLRTPMAALLEDEEKDNNAYVDAMGAPRLHLHYHSVTTLSGVRPVIRLKI